jgi:short-subunit dehydrogenase
MLERVPSTVLITGPTSGIGEALARLFARQGHNLVLVSRSRDRLDFLAADLSRAHGISCHVLPKDLTDPSAPDELFRELEYMRVPVDILVNNAGFGNFGKFIDTDLRSELEVLAVNVVALAHLSKQFLLQVPAGARGRIMNVASVAAFQPGPWMAVYCATKAYVLSFSEALACELEGTNVTVTALCPGPTATGFTERSKMGDSRLFKGKEVMTADEVAKIGYRALMKGRVVVVPGIWNALLAFSGRFLPRALLTRISGYLVGPAR